MYLMFPVGTLGFRKPQQTSNFSSPGFDEDLSGESVNGLLQIRVMAAPPPLLLILGVDMLCSPCTSFITSTNFGNIDLLLATMMLGKDKACTVLLSLLIVVL